MVNNLKGVGKLEKFEWGEEDGSDINTVLIYEIQKVNTKIVYIMLIFKEIT